MKRICYICRKHFGDKEPLNDTSETHGLCSACFRDQIRKIKSYQKKEITHQGRELKESSKEI
jgi:hypothetical protein